MSSAFASLEAAWDELRHEIEDRVVARHRGLPVGDADYPGHRRAFAAALAAIAEDGLEPEERRGLASIRSALGILGSLEPVDGLDESIADDGAAGGGAGGGAAGGGAAGGAAGGGAGGGAAGGGAGAAAAGGSAGESPIIAALRRSTEAAYGEAASAIVVRGETIDRLTAFARLATRTDQAERRAVFEAMAPVWRAVDGDGHAASPYRQLVAASAERWARDGSAIDANAAMLGIEPAGLEGMLWRILAAGRDVVAAAAGLRPGRRIEPWDYRFVVGAAERRLLEVIPLARLRAVNDAHLRSLGADPDELAIGYDIVPRPGRPVIPVAFTIGGRPGPWVFASYLEGGLGNLGELIHESGHALHVAAIDTRPAFADPPEDFSAFFEGVADLLGWDADEPAVQERHLGRAATPVEAALSRYGSVLLDVCWSLFEIELHRAPGRRANDVWAEIVADGLGVEPHPEWSWWAVRGQLIEAPGYLANYALSAITAAALRARLRELRGDWSAGDPGWYAFVSERLLRYGGARPPAELIVELLGGPLTEAPLLADLARAGTASGPGPA